MKQDTNFRMFSYNLIERISIMYKNYNTQKLQKHLAVAPTYIAEWCVVQQRSMCTVHMCYWPDSDVKSAMTVWITCSTCAIHVKKILAMRTYIKQLLVQFSCVRSAWLHLYVAEQKTNYQGCSSFEKQGRNIRKGFTLTTMKTSKP